MADNTERINQLLARLELLAKKQDVFAGEINLLRSELNQLKNLEQELVVEEVIPEVPVIENVFVNTDENRAIDHKTFLHQLKNETAAKAPKIKSDVEKFIGENLINKIGIAITVIGVGIGAKYSIDNGLISPLTRIILGYLFGLGLLGLGMKLKSKYENYSAVLVSGAMAIMYFITYAAYGFYDLIPQIAAFALMLIFTIFTVIAALNFNKQVIAIIGLVGAYAVPFLLSEGSGNVTVLFSYMAILNTGILAIAFRKYWKQLYYVSFGLTWLIFLSWYLEYYRATDHFTLALVFLSLFFVIFYLTLLAYKLLQKEKFVVDDVILLMINSFFYFGMGYALLADHHTGALFLGLFTLCNAIVHFMVSVLVYRQKLADKNLLSLIAGLVLVFITIAVPVQLDGNWVTLLWAGEAALLFWIGRTKNVPFYEKLSYPLMLLALFSIVQDWTVVYDSYNVEYPDTRITPIFNVHFLTSLLFVSAFAFINVLHLNKNYPSFLNFYIRFSKVISVVLPAILIFSLYYTFRLEIANYWNQLYADSVIKVAGQDEDYPDYYRNYDLLLFKSMWILNYSFFFVSLLVFINLKKFKDPQLGLVGLGLIAFALFVFLADGLSTLSLLAGSYFDQSQPRYYQKGVMSLWMRYITFSFVALSLVAGYTYVRRVPVPKKLKIAFDLLLHITILWVASSELIYRMEMMKSEQSYKFGLSILWGLYSLFVIVLGIWKKNKPLRLAAIFLFGITLLKLFFYDMEDLNTIAKTIAFVSLGILLLIISFLYNKYKHLISDDEAVI